MPHGKHNDTQPDDYCSGFGQQGPGYAYETVVRNPVPGEQERDGHPEQQDKCQRRDKP